MDINSLITDKYTFKPSHPLKIYYVVREQTFENWPRQIVQKPDALIQNGFFYTGCGDRVTCFYCNLTLKQWEPNDCIETEHLKWEPNCLFARMISRRIPNFDLFRCC